MTLAVLIARSLSRRRLRVYVVAVGAVLTMLIGITRLYLGVHYPTDVVAGWTAGALWALVSGLVVFRLGKRGVEGVPAPVEEE
jgi:undecaprenyl-diphosphatase